MKKRKKEKTNRDIKGLITYFQDNNFFKNLLNERGLKALQELYKELLYFYTKEGEFVMKEGEIGYTYYIIVQGTVEILINAKQTKSFK